MLSIMVNRKKKYIGEYQVVSDRMLDPFNPKEIERKDGRPG